MKIFLTYGDGVSNINIRKLLKFHLKNNKIATITAVRPPVKFGELIINKNSTVKSFKKTQVSKGWINGGFFVLNRKYLILYHIITTCLSKDP